MSLFSCHWVTEWVIHIFKVFILVLLDLLFCVPLPAAAVWGDYVLSRNPTVTRSIHNPHSASYIHHFYRACTIECSHNWLTAFKQYYWSLILIYKCCDPTIVFGFSNCFLTSEIHLNLDTFYLLLHFPSLLTEFRLCAVCLPLSREKFCHCVKVLVMSTATLHCKPHIHILRRKGGDTTVGFNQDLVALR